MVEQPQFPTLEEIKKQFPPRPEEHQVTVTVDKKRATTMVDSVVSRNGQRDIVYVVPGSTQYRDKGLAAKLSNTPEE